MKISRRSMVLGFVGLGFASALVGGIGIAAAEPTPQSSAPAAMHNHERGQGHGQKHGQGHGKTIRNAAMTAAANYLGLSQDDLKEQLKAGRSLADVAKDRDKPVSGLKDAMITAVENAIKSDTTLTNEQKTECLKMMKSRIAKMINQTHKAGEGRGHGPRGGQMHEQQ